MGGSANVLPLHYLLCQHQYASALLYLTIIGLASLPFSIPYAAPLPFFCGASNRNLPTQHSKYYHNFRPNAALSSGRTTPSSPFQFLPLRYPTPKNPICLTATEKYNNDDDDGWKTEETNLNPSDRERTISYDSSSSFTTDSPSSTELSPEAELESLRKQIANKRIVTTENNSGGGYNSPNTEPTRDLFIPIVSVVSLAGLFGAYGYEMLRLYQNGELYLPWNQ